MAALPCDLGASAPSLLHHLEDPFGGSDSRPVDRKVRTKAGNRLTPGEVVEIHAHLNSSEAGDWDAWK